MRRKIMFVLSIAMLSYSINVSAGMIQIEYDEEGYTNLDDTAGIENVSSNSVISQNGTISWNTLVSANEIAVDGREEITNNTSNETVSSETGNISSNTFVSTNKTPEILAASEEVTENTLNEADSAEIGGVSSDGFISANGTPEILTEPIQETPTDRTDELETLSENIANPVPEKDIITKVKIPTNTRVYLDPENLAGRGGIFSDSYEVINYGNTDVAIKIKNIDIVCGSPEVFAAFSENRTENRDAVVMKESIDLNMVWDNENEDLKKVLHIKDGKTDEYVIYLKAAEYSKDDKLIRVDDSGKCLFYFTGTLNTKQDALWTDEKMSIHFDYEIINLQEDSVGSVDESIMNILAIEDEGPLLAD